MMAWFWLLLLFPHGWFNVNKLLAKLKCNWVINFPLLICNTNNTKWNSYARPQTTPPYSSHGKGPTLLHAGLRKSCYNDLLTIDSTDSSSPRHILNHSSNAVCRQNHCNTSTHQGKEDSEIRNQQSTVEHSPTLSYAASSMLSYMPNAYAGPTHQAQ